MGGKYLIRIDDVTPEMNWEAFIRAKKLFQKYGVKPIVGIVPKNNDQNLIVNKINSYNFWDEMRLLQNEGWAMALHGYNHVYASNGKNLLKINAKSEFAGLSLKLQFQKIVNGVEIFSDQKIIPKCFFAPSHTFDLNTITALKQAGIRVIVDGYSFYPYNEYGMQFIPQLLGKPFKFPFGLHTSVHHFNEYTSSDFFNLEKFLKENFNSIITIDEAFLLERNYMCRKIVSKILCQCLRIKRVIS